MVKISICIPTYNRAVVLQRNLEKILSELSISPFCNFFEVCISDNASTDRTLETLENLKHSYSNLRYTKNVKNQGFGKNLWNAVEAAKGEYVLLCGDDDEIATESLLVIYELVQSLTPDLIITNSDQKVFPIEKNETIKIESLDQYISEMGAFHATFIGNLIFKKSMFSMTKQGSYISDSAYPHMVPVLNCLAHDNVYFLNTAVVNPDDQFRSWRDLQPIYTSVDLARIYSEFGIRLHRCSFRNRIKLIILFSRSLPRALINHKKIDILIDKKNKFNSLCINNLLRIYAPFFMHLNCR